MSNDLNKIKNSIYKLIVVSKSFQFKFSLVLSTSLNQLN